MTSELQRSRKRSPEPALGLLALGLLALVTLGSAPAKAGDFFADGSFGFDPQAVIRHDFEAELPAAGPLVRVQSETALSGKWVLQIETYASVDVPLELPAEPRTYRVSLWIRGAEAVGYLGLAYGHESRLDEVATLYPTGRLTSDGWVELANEGLRVDGGRLKAAVAGAFSTGGTELDALEVVPDGLPDVELLAPCGGAADGAACGTGQLCYWSECRSVNGWVPPIPPDRDAVTDYLESRLRFFFGPYLERTVDLPAALTALQQMRSAADPWTYWNSFMLAVRRLHDGHTSTGGTADYIIENPKPLNVCFIEGQADLSQAAAPSDGQYLDVLVSHVGPEHHLNLQPGDRLVAVDGRHPLAWARSLIDQHWAQPVVSNHETFAEHTARLRALISRFAQEIEVIRCNPAAGTCGPVETVSIAALPADEPGTALAAVACDNRPLRHVPGAPADHAGSFGEVFSGLLVESDPAERIYGVEWESLMTTDGQNGVGANLHAAIALLQSQSAAGVIFDHRTGTGGTDRGSAIVWDFAVPRQPLTLMQTRRRAEDEQPSLAEGLAFFQAAVSSNEVLYAGGVSPTDIPVALLLTLDVSASDWLALGLKGADNVRLFGPYQTNGAFSTRLQFGYWFGLTYQLATCDTFAADGRTLNGTGVEPDVTVLPLQSDLLAGRDTVFDAALSWIRQELTP